MGKLHDWDNCRRKVGAYTVRWQRLEWFLFPFISLTIQLISVIAVWHWCVEGWTIEWVCYQGGGDPTCLSFSPSTNAGLVTCSVVNNNWLQINLQFNSYWLQKIMVIPCRKVSQIQTDGWEMLVTKLLSDDCSRRWFHWFGALLLWILLDWLCLLWHCNPLTWGWEPMASILIFENLVHEIIHSATMREEEQLALSGVLKLWLPWGSCYTCKDCQARRF